MLVGIYIPQRADGDEMLALDQLEGEYLGHALRVLQKVNKDTNFVCFSESASSSMGDGIPTQRISRRSSLFRPISGNTPTLEVALAQSGADVLLTTLDAPSVHTKIPKVLFALDLVLPGVPPPKNKIHPVIPRSVKRNCADARLIICPSTHMQKACSAHVEVGLEKTVLARAGVDTSFSKTRTSIIDGPYMLFPMNRYTFHHISTVTEGIKRNPALFAPTLVIMGPIYKKEPTNWGLPIIRVEKCPDNIASTLLQNADAVLYPAQGDGSGMMALQALRAGATLLTSKSGANFEVAGTVPFYFEADSSVSMLQIMRRMLDESPKEKERRQQTGRTLVMDCTWERCATKIVSALKRGLL